MKVINPATEEIIADIEDDNLMSVNKKFYHAQKAQKDWADVPIDERLGCIEKFVQLIEEQKDILAKTLTDEVGKPLKQSYGELKGAQYRTRFFLENSKEYLKEEWMVTAGVTKEKLVYEPLGVIANISAWNYPYLVGVNVIVPALIAGNSVLYKPSEYATLTGIEIGKLLHQSGIPKHVFQTVIGGGQTGQALLELPLDGYFFTGSYQTGKYIATQVASRLVPCQLELGGNDPLYVMDDVEDIQGTAASVAEGFTYNAGQSCCAVKRIYINKKIYEQFLPCFKKEVEQLHLGDPMESDTDIGPLIKKEQVYYLEELINDALSKGATILCGNQPYSGKGNFIIPTVLIGVNHDMRIMKEETFGPVIGIQKVTDDEEAFNMMSDTEYGLTASVFSKGKKRAESILNRLHTGNVYWNCCDRVSPYLPWSGRNKSGLGTTLSYIGIRAFVQPKGYHLRS